MLVGWSLNIFSDNLFWVCGKAERYPERDLCFVWGCLFDVSCLNISILKKQGYFRLKIALFVFRSRRDKVLIDDIPPP